MKNDPDSPRMWESPVQGRWSSDVCSSPICWKALIRDWRPAGRLQSQALPTVHMAFPQEGTARALWIRNPVFRSLTQGQAWVQRGRDAPAITCKSLWREECPGRWSSTFTGSSKDCGTQRDLETPFGGHRRPFQMGTLRHREGQRLAQGHPGTW